MKRRSGLTAVFVVLALFVGFVFGRWTASWDDGEDQLSVADSTQETESTSIETQEEESQEEDTASSDSYDISEEIPTEDTEESEDETTDDETEDADESSDSDEDKDDNDEDDNDEDEEDEEDEDDEDEVDDSDEENDEDDSDEDESDEETELVDAADEEYDFTTEGEVVTHEAVTEVSSEITVVDVSTIENVTLYEAVLPDGVASTLYGKDGDALFQVVVIGDSQFGNYTGKDGMAYMLSEKMHANVYNLSIGGKTASVDPEEKGNNDVDSWEETCGVSMVKAVCGDADPEEVFDGWDYQMNVFNSCDFSKTDFFVLEFGVNDFLADREMADSEDLDDYYTLYGALETMVLDLRYTYPDAQIMICTPTYAQFWESGTGAYIGDSYITSNDYGTLYNYVQTVSHVSGEHEQVSTVNTYDNAGINIYTAPEDLLDGIHLTEDGREKYVNLLARRSLYTLGIEVGEGEDPDNVDWISQMEELGLLDD